MNKRNILDLKNLNVEFQYRKHNTEIIKNISFAVDSGEIVGVVGESGSGKSVTMKAIMGLLPENAKISCEKMELDGKSLLQLNESEMRKIRGRDMTMIFQDPMTALNPLIKVGEQLKEVIVRNFSYDKRKAKLEAINMMRKVGISIPDKRYNQYPHELSGGMRQRILIAMALVGSPKVLFADEPTTALDVTIQAQILDLLKSLQKDYQTSVVLITHDLGVVASICTRVIVMYGGMIMEEGTIEEIFYHTLHPYTKALLSTVPTLDIEEGERLKTIDGSPIILSEKYDGCPFAKRCTKAQEKCHFSVPPLKKVSDTHRVMCFIP